jgi:methionyl-tRNA formyltransferase
MKTQTRIVLATPHERHDRLEAALRARPTLHVTRLRTPVELTAANLKAIAPAYVFLPHWSTLIPASVYGEFECVVFHMTDLPFGRGGSPLQNLIVRGIYDTRISALRCDKELDAGPIFSQRPLSLHGSAEEIFLRAGTLIEEMIIEIVANKPTPRPQVGEPTLFRRRQPADSDIAALASLERVHDHIRMLDAAGYPKAFLRIGRLRLEFGRSRLAHDHVLADVRITVVSDEEAS